MESPMCNHPYFAGKISREEFRRGGIRPYETDTAARSQDIIYVAIHIYHSYNHFLFQ